MPKLTVISISLLIFLAACGTNRIEEQNSPEVGTDITEENEKEPVEEPTGGEVAIELHDFFMPDDSTATFFGEGNEYASFTLRTVYLDDQHIATYEDNGGTVMLKVYRIGENTVELVKEQAEFYEDFNASSEELEALNPIRTYLTFPLEIGMEIDKWTVTETGTTVETPYKNFEDVIVFESKETENTTNKIYFAMGYGEVKREFQMQEEGQDEFIVTSALETVK